LPHPLSIRIWILPRKRVRQVYAAESIGQILFMLRASLEQMPLQSLGKICWQHGDAVFAALALAHGDGQISKVAKYVRNAVISA
jgi:hypothetical protein